MRNLRLVLALFFTICAFSAELSAQVSDMSYAYISIEGKVFSKKLKVIVDLGDNPSQIETGEQYSKVLTDKRSYAAILNYMVDEGFELVETLSLIESSSYQGTGAGGTTGIIFIMKKKK